MVHDFQPANNEGASGPDAANSLAPVPCSTWPDELSPSAYLAAQELHDPTARATNAPLSRPLSLEDGASADGVWAEMRQRLRGVVRRWLRMARRL
eukprot:TRINITY_DN5059_c0_g2_i1.p4 TRINITY_DN5059_c0_g2~~TRINITY_DN5059_c0_g2_i1.p4  ORF type:complete len:104 (+),score=16.89 TRINITY_DN5059_c0_g2_i1:28-312(+)